MAIGSTMPVIRDGKSMPVPKSDGDVTLYTHNLAVTNPGFQHKSRAIFVNGMDNTGDDHAEAAIALSLLHFCPVLGVFNQSGGKGADIAQCIADKGVLAPVQSKTVFGYAGWAAAVDAAYAIVKKVKPQLSKIDFVGTIVSGNAATAALYALLVNNSTDFRRDTPIFCHSQGNLLTSNALTAVSLALGPDAIRGVEVNSYGSPCRYWPDGINRTNYAFTFDPVSWLDLRVDTSSSKVGQAEFRQGFLLPEFTHGYSFYRDHDAEFVVNRFRTGSFGMTVAMDEKGLVKFLLRNVHNTPRVYNIFKRLQKIHDTDSDDVALLFVDSATDLQLRTIKQREPALFKLFTTLLKSGWTAADEQRAINRLAKL